MLDQLTYVVIGYAALVTIGCLLVAALRRPRPVFLDQAAWILEGLFVVRFIAGVGALLAGHKAAEPAPYLGYLFASICIMPVAMGTMSDDRGPWSTAVIGVAALALTVIGIRLQMTWTHG